MQSDLGEVLFEIQIIGNIARATAIHAASGLEVTISGPARMPSSGLRDAALKKLIFVMKQNSGQAQTEPIAPVKSKGRGTLV